MDRRADGRTDGRYGALEARANDITNNKRETEFWRHPRSDAINNNLRPTAFHFRYSVLRTGFCQTPQCSVVGVCPSKTILKILYDHLHPLSRKSFNQSADGILTLSNFLISMAMSFCISVPKI